jgi:hypothetical protein
LARAGKLAERYLCYALADGRIVLQPATVVSQLELSMLGDPEAVERVDEGRRELDEGAVGPRGWTRNEETTASMRTFRNPSSATLAPLGGRPIAIRWMGRPAEEVVEIPPEVDMTASYDAVPLDDGRIILTPTGVPLDRPDAEAPPATEKASPARKIARSAPTPATKKASRATATRATGSTRAAGAAAATGRSRASGRPTKASAQQRRKRS